MDTRFSIFTLSILLLITTSVSAQESSPGALVYLGTGDQLQVVPLEQYGMDRALPEDGLLLWSHEGVDRWLPLDNWRQALREPRGASQQAGPAWGTRGAASDPGAAMVVRTPDLDELSYRIVMASNAPESEETGPPPLEEVFLTPRGYPADLDGQVTFRRAAPEHNAAPAITVQLLRQGEEKAVLEFPVDQGQLVQRWSEIPDLPKELKKGLPPGQYTLALADSDRQFSFQVADKELRSQVLQDANRMADLLGSRKDPLYVLFAVESLISHKDQGGFPTPHLADALELIEQTTDAKQTPGLRELKVQIERQLAGETRQARIDFPTGIEPIDRARELIRDANWEAARERLDRLREDGSRAAGLAELYRGVILAESAAASTASAGADAEALFENAIEILKEQAPEDLYRAYNNYATFLMRRAQDRLYNHAMLAATGSESPLQRTLVDWAEARRYFEQALRLAEQSDSHQAAGVRVNLARLHALLADILRTLTVDDQPAFPEGLGRARTLARQQAAVATQSQASLMTRAVAHEILADLAYRAGDTATARRQARKALTRYVNDGSLAGTESVYRLLGLLHARDKTDVSDTRSASEPQPTTAPDVPEQASAEEDPLRYLRVSSLITELLRERIPPDEAGVSVAGFFARRAFVHEQIVSLLIQRGERVEALRFAEQAKAGALQDVLAAGGITSTQPRRSDPPKIDDILHQWPAETAVLEYFIGSDRVWVFAISPLGQVQVQVLRNDDGEVLAPRVLIADTRRLLDDMQLKASKLSQRVSAGEPFDVSWQDDLHRFYNVLIPEGVRSSIQDASQVVVIPHHILHYFPFAALVTEIDDAERGPHEMPMPQFLIDRSIALTYAPSLTVWAMLRGESADPIEQVNAVGIVEFERASPLPGVKDDLNNLRAQFASQLGTKVDGGHATESRVAKLLGRRGMLFVATHGVNLPDRPLDSYVLCHAGEEEDGRLTAAELYQTNVAANLIVLSACYSALADRSPVPGDDLFGLQRAFLNSGARAVVAGLWDVYDATGPLLMDRYFLHLDAGQGAALALAKAQREFLARRRENGPQDPWIHPYFWAVYNCTGTGEVKMAE